MLNSLESTKLYESSKLDWTWMQFDIIWTDLGEISDSGKSDFDKTDSIIVETGVYS